MNELAFIDSECIRCGRCKRQQAAEGMPALACGALARELALAEDSSQLSPEAREFLLSCSLCDACTTGCPRLISCAQLVRAGREKLLRLQPELAEEYRAFRVDYRENLFTALRAAAGFVYEDALDAPPVQDTQPGGLSPGGEDGISLFFPGCSLASYSEALTRAACDLLLSAGIVQGMSVYCCGRPLANSGLKAVHERYEKGFLELLRQRGVSHMVVGCPNCFAALSELLQSHDVGDITLAVLPQVLLDLGLRYSAGEFASIAVHDSCPDRSSLSFAGATRALFEAEDLRLLEMQDHGSNTLCCGAGGLAQVCGPTQSAERRIRRLRQFAQTGAECLVCSCMSCVNAFLSSSNAPRTCHYLELILDTPIDWQATQLAFDTMQLHYRHLLTLPLAESTRVFDA
ncbi:MAG: (Fe-S)-binding protein [Coriobacteriales bacterium]|jgi:Fe-S oxidoreductase|nr:(Fe-S)-binding protein [Coriobacteriales bacterium]